MGLAESLVWWAASEGAWRSAATAKWRRAQQRLLGIMEGLGGDKAQASLLSCYLVVRKSIQTFPW